MARSTAQSISELPMVRPSLSEPTNLKLGFGIHGWSLPAILTCPGMSHLCGRHCYAIQGFFLMPTVATAHARNYAFSKSADFASWMRQILHARFVKTLRVHVSGDFYDVDYTRKWRQIVEQSRGVTFFAYTRSWRQDDILPELLQLARYPNMHLWWSIDRETGPAPLVRGVKRAYMAIDDADADSAPNDCDLVFRDQTRTILKRANGVLVCPPEQGIDRKPEITCTRCGICWKNNKPPMWESAMLPAIQRIQD
jgi:hypothetical protein